MKKVLNFTAKWLIILVATFGFLALCNFSLHMGNWNGFSRFIIGLEGILFIIDLLYEI